MNEPQNKLNITNFILESNNLAGVISAGGGKNSKTKNQMRAIIWYSKVQARTCREHTEQFPKIKNLRGFAPTTDLLTLSKAFAPQE